MNLAGAEQIQLDNLMAWLKEWAAWMAQDNHRLGYPAKSLGISSGYVGCASAGFDELCDEADARMLKVIDTAINDLTPVQASAIHNRYLRSVFRFPRIDYPLALASAHAALLATLPAKGVQL